MKKKTTVPKKAKTTVPQIARPGAGQLIPITAPEVSNAQVELSSQIPWLYRETNSYLDRLARAAKEGKNLMEAANYCRWLAFSGIFAILDKCTLPMNTHGEELRRKNQKVIEECGRHFQGGKIDPNYQASDIAEINRKLDLLLSGGGPVSVVDAPLPMPKAIGGGL